MAAAAGYAPRGAAYKKIRVAVLGTGHAHALGKIQTLRSLPEYEFVGICRPDPDEPNEGDVFRGVRWLSMEELLDERAAIELIDVESRVERNLQYAQKCVSAGKFVHLDKAPGEDLAGLQALLAEASSRKRVVQMGYQWRYHPAMQAAIEPRGTVGWGASMPFAPPLTSLSRPMSGASWPSSAGV